MIRKGRKRLLHRLLSLAVCTLIIAGLTPKLSAAGTLATRSSQPIYVDNILVDITMYLINDNNYVRLRDIGQTVGFNVVYDANTRAIHIMTDEPYSGDDTALGQTPEIVETQAALQTIYIDGERTYISTYLIGGNNYVKLVNLGAAVGFGVSWDGTNKRVLVDSLKPQAVAVPQDMTSAMTLDEMKLEIVRLTNIERVKAGVPELEVLPALMDCAQLKADDMKTNHYYGHKSPVFGTSGEMIRSLIPRAGWTGENLAPWTKSPQEAFDGWVNSSGHFSNIVNPNFSYIGVGIIVGAEGGFWWVQQFLSIA